MDFIKGIFAVYADVNVNANEFVHAHQKSMDFCFTRPTPPPNSKQCHHHHHRRYHHQHHHHHHYQCHLNSMPTHFYEANYMQALLVAVVVAVTLVQVDAADDALSCRCRHTAT